MRFRMHDAIALYCLTAMLAIAAEPGLEGTWASDGVPAVEAAKKAGKSINGLAEGTKIKFKVDTKQQSKQSIAGYYASLHVTIIIGVQTQISHNMQKN